MIDELRKIGLSDLEARCYLVLHEEPKISGYEVAKKVSVSRTNVYAALRSLTDKGMCRVIESEPVLYDAVPIEQLVRLLQSEFEQTTRSLLEQLHSPPRTSPSFYSWQGDKAIETAIRRLVSNADKSIVVDIWSEDVHWVEGPLVEAEKRGLAITLISIGECHTCLKNVLVHKRSDEWKNVGARKFSILCDTRSALLGSFGKELKPTVLETDHPSLIELLQNAFYHDVIMEQIERDFSKELADKYGNHYERIIDSYRKYL
ncbi:TrmB family transcriptional regulator [Aneurinibacillus migulanus]|uniref:Sugar-specific transcriptional regulator TrmB n=1 Tax=Aneurinibacillus migulanus TaxID=47500 RepID=A0A0D1W9L9_ANEMI|nr:TrmB family transcriptional regulator [Aneurinibacillus migulanus]KIV55305.1 TrmB family transcriptional regulator [Aneurinibacillus migulanus]KON96704.1 TrmB family transcriptional regulator [Aneurinibacillus migulanus]MED0895685.1 helix-turn-helix domain-containing protein [Aneurinibacillus migulanus]MED1619819.1 helix-turn-helix domain-containing protein [Aneurinibacillus migulanus]SDK48614.1 Sugar-specific transcriptional regulator TrmB [Aneurinibacillus migulanus]